MVPHSWDPALALTQCCAVPAQPGTEMPHFEREHKWEKLLRCGAVAGRAQKQHGAPLPCLGITQYSGLSWLCHLSRPGKRPISQAVIQKGRRIWLKKERTVEGWLRVPFPKGKLTCRARSTGKDRCSLETTQCTHLY